MRLGGASVWWSVHSFMAASSAVVPVTTGDDLYLVCLSHFFNQSHDKNPIMQCMAGHTVSVWLEVSNCAARTDCTWHFWNCNHISSWLIESVLYWIKYIIAMFIGKMIRDHEFVPIGPAYMRVALHSQSLLKVTLRGCDGHLKFLRFVYFSHLAVQTHSAENVNK